YLYKRSGGAARELPAGAGPAIDPQLSPDGKKVAYVRERDLYVLDLEGKKARRLTESRDPRVSNGLAQFVAPEGRDRMSGFWRSPDGRALAFEEADTRPVETFHLTDVTHPEAEVEPTPYPRAGGKNANVRLGVVPVAGGRPQFVEWDHERFPYLARVVWKN